MKDLRKTKKQLTDKLVQARHKLADASIKRQRPPEATRQPQETDNTYYKVFLTSPDLSIIVDPADGTYIEVNDAFIKHTGYTREELIGHGVLESNVFADPDDFQRMGRIFKELGRVTNEEISLRTKSGETRRWTCSAEMININGTDRLIAVATDTTERRQMEEALKFTEAAFKSIHEGIVVTDNNNTITYWNEMSEEIFGIKASEAIGKKIDLVTKPIQRYPGHEKQLLKFLHVRGYNRDEMIFKTPRGRLWLDVTIRNIDIEGKIRGRVVTYLDITKRKQEEENHRAILNTAIDGFWITDLDGRILEVNDSYCRMMGYTHEEMRGMLVKDFEVIENPQDIRRHISKVVNEGSDRFETKHKRKDGRIIDVEVSTNYLDIGEGQISVFVRDITERKQEEAKHRAILSTSLDGFSLNDLKGNILEVNDAFCNMIGYSRQELLGMTIMDIEALHSPDKINNNLTSITKEGAARFETKHKCKDGRIIDVEISTNYLDIGEGQISVFVRDITERKQEEAKHRAILSSSLDGFWMVDLKGNILEVNDSYCRMIGYTREELLGMSIMDIEAKQPPEDIRSGIQKIKTNGSDRFETSHKRKDGRIIDVEISANYMNIGEGQISVFVRDITERKRAEGALRESEERYIILSEATTDAVIIHEGGKTLDANQSAATMLGYEQSDLIGRNASDFLTPESSKTVMHKTSSGDETPYEVEYVRKDGTIFSGEVRAKNILYHGRMVRAATMRDITERKRAEEALREREAQLQGILKAAPLGIVLDRNRTSVWVNDYFSSMTGYSPEELIGKSGRLLCRTDEECEEYNRILLEGIERYGIGEMEAALTCKNGKVIDVLVKSTPLNPDDPSAGRIATFLDITERKKGIEKEREAKNLRDLDRLRTELLANVSHELRTPLASIKGFTTVLMDYDQKLEPGEKDEYLEIINHNTDRLSELIEQIMVMSRLDAGILTIDKEPSDIKILCRKALAEARIRSPEHQFTLDLPARLPRAYIDPRRIRQVLDNLIDNAVKFSNPGTQITITAHKNSREDILVTVTDQGIGIPQKDLSHLFNRRFHIERKTKPAKTGAGLGLSICKGLIEAHQGSIWIESQEGKGTSCFFTVAVYNQQGGSGDGKKARR